MSRDERREAIARATVPLLEEHGAQVSTRQIAQAAGVAEGTLFRAFDDKVELMTAAVERVLDPSGRVAALDALPATRTLADEVTQVVDDLTETARRVRRVMIGVHGVLASDEGRRSAQRRPATGDGGGRPFGRHGHGPGPDARARALLEIRAAVARRLAPYAAELRTTPDVAAQLLMALTAGQNPPGVPEGADVPVDVLVDVLLHGVARPPGTAGAA